MNLNGYFEMRFFAVAQNDNLNLLVTLEKWVVVFAQKIIRLFNEIIFFSDYTFHFIIIW